MRGSPVRAVDRDGAGQIELGWRDEDLESRYTLGLHVDCVAGSLGDYAAIGTGVFEESFTGIHETGFVFDRPDSGHDQPVDSGKIIGPLGFPLKMVR